MARRFDAVLFDAGGVLLLPDPLVFGPLLGYYGGDPSIEAHRRAHYAGMHAKSVVDAAEGEWEPYNRAYLEAIGVPEHERAAAAEVFQLTRGARLWRWVIPETRVALDALAEAGVPMGVVSNAYGQIAEVLAREVCQVGPGAHVEVRCIVDSHLVGVAKPDPSIFDHALPHFDGFDRARIAYVGDSVTMDVGAARGAGLHPILVDPYDDHVGADFERIPSVTALAEELIGDT
jgi:putative hydrolase of the HAD superfamily